ncbi:hypothetical protein BD410DRAFT_645845 [Rickenella mellea]|uniref:Uncharacterized protein n=1 Tax=Rickenella mellea TaxID=50990 RepID=A0A4Y7PLP0_9AGAM|nr:hypothetical protein BD410DRAFT_645845 [Rickenella mellea]
MAQPKHLNEEPHTINANTIQVKSMNAHEVFETAQRCMKIDGEIRVYIDREGDLSDHEYDSIMSLRKEKDEREAEILANIERFTDLEPWFGKVRAELLDAYDKCWGWQVTIKAVRHETHDVGGRTHERPVMIMGMKDGVPHETRVVSGTAQDIHSSVEFHRPIFHYPDHEKVPESLLQVYTCLKYWLHHQASHKSGEVHGAASGNKL